MRASAASVSTGNSWRESGATCTQRAVGSSGRSLGSQRSPSAFTSIVRTSPSYENENVAVDVPGTNRVGVPSRTTGGRRSARSSSAARA